MKKRLLIVNTKGMSMRIFLAASVFFLSILFGSGRLAAQTTVQIGSGTATQSYFPIYTCYGYNYSQQIYTASEISAAGGFVGTISQIKFYYNSGGTSLSTWNSWTVYLGNTSLNNFTGTAGWVPLGSLTQVFSGNITAVAGNWVTLTLTTPFSYTGGNIVVAVDENSANYSCTAAWRSFSTTAASGPRGILYYSDFTNPNPSSPPTANYSSTTVRSQVQFVMTPSAGCSGTPNAGTASISSSSGCVGSPLTLSATGLTSASGITYQWQSAPTSTGPWTNISGATTASSSVLSQAGQTYYRLVTTCTNSVSSNNTNVVSYNGDVVNGCTCLNYGSSIAQYSWDDEIFNVNFAGINNTTSCSSTAPGPGSINRQYGNYTGSVPAANAMQGVTYNLSITAGQCDGWAYGGGITVYIDYNQDGDFNDTGEMVYASPYSTFAVAGTTFSSNITIPLTATPGMTRMRVICSEGITNAGPTAAYSYGETEDYCVNIAVTNACSGTPNTGTATISSTGGCPNSNFNLGSTGISTGLGLIYQWQSASSSTGPWSNIPGATATSYSTSVTASGTTYYRLVTTCINSVISSNSSVVSYTASGGQCDCGTYPAIYSYYSGDEEITNVTVGTLNNSSNCGTTAPGPGSINQLYSNYTGSVFGPSVNQGDVVNFSLTQTTCGGAYTNIFQIFVDFNQDGDFLDAGEFVYNQPTGVSGNQTQTGSFLVPANALLGTTRMRVVNAESGPTATNYAHNQYYWGETEDYCFTVTSPPPCAGTPVPGNTIATPASVFAGQSTVLSMQNSTPGTGISYQWQSSSSATGPWTNISGATSYNYTVTPTATTWYQCIVTCINSGSAGTSTPVQVLYNPYCNPAYIYGTQYGDLISNVAIPTTTLNNNSGTATNGPAYTYYSNIPAPTLQAATSYSLQVTAGSYTYQAFAAWIDYNDNYIFEPSEKIGFSPAYTTAPFQTVTFQINLACTPPLGLHRMRVRGVYATAGSTIDPCATYYYGETEDYNVNIVAGAPFTPSFAAAPNPNACTYTDYTYTTQSGMQNYTWTIPGTVGVDYTLVSGGSTTSNSLTVQWLTSGSKTVSINYLNASGCVSTGAVSNTVTVQSTVLISPLTGTQSVCEGSQVTFATPTPGGTWSSNNSNATIVSTSGVVTGVSAGASVMTYTVPNPGTWCPASTATRSITILPTPVLTAGSSASICAGSSTNLTSTIGFNTTCNQTITLYDSYGDGWNGCSATVYVGGIAVLSNITLGSGYGPLSYTFPATNGQAIQVTFSAASWPYEPYFTITNGAGTNLVTNYYPYSSGTWNGTASGCASITPVWSPATGLSAANILNPVASPSSTQTYTMTAAAPNGCSATTAPITVTVLPVPANAPIVGPSTACVGSQVNYSNPVSGGVWSSSNNAIVNLNGISGTGIASNGGNATISYTTTGANGCTTTNTATLAVAAVPVAAITPSGSTAICQGSSVTLTASPAATYLWNNNATTQSITVSSGGSFTVEVSNAAGCPSVISSPTTVSVNQLPVASISANGSTVFCQGGSVNLTASGGVSYAWSNQSTSATLNATTSGAYFVVATDQNGCQASSNTINVNVNPLPATLITASGPTSFCQGGNVSLTASGNGIITWSNNLPSQSILVSNSGTYSYTLTDANGCTATSAPMAITVSAIPVVPAITGSNNVCANATTPYANAMPGGTWSSSNNLIASVDPTGLIGGVSNGVATITYQVTQNGCSASVSKLINVSPAPLATISALGSTTFCDGSSVSLAASSGAQYAWSTGETSQVISVSTTSNPTVTVTGSNGCSATSAPLAITVNPVTTLAPITLVAPICLGSSASASNPISGGTWSCANPNVAQINPTTGAYIGNSTGSTSIVYSYTNPNGCTSTLSAPIVVEPIPLATTSVSGSTVFCQGNSITISAPAAPSYLWNNGATTQSISVNASGSYFVEISNGVCTSTSPTTLVTVYNAPVATISSSSTAICQGSSVTLTASAAPSYLWSNGATTQSITVNNAGSYTVTETNGFGCSNTSAPMSISVSALPSAYVSANGPTTFCNGSSVALSANAGATYLWSNGATTQNITANASGIYFVTITNAAGCSAVSNEIVVNAQQTFVATATAVGPTTVCDGAFVTLVASPGSSYLWSNGATTQGINAGVNGNYTVTILNSLGCSSTSASIPVTILPVPVAGISASGPTTFCEGGSVTLTGSGGNTYMWNSSFNGSTYTATQGGTYVVTAFGPNGCSDAAEIVVTVNESPSPTLQLDGNTILCPGESLEISAQPNNGYTWSNNATTQSITVTTPGTYSVVLTGLNGCTSNSELVNVTAGSATTSTINATGGNSYTLNEVVYTQSGTYTQIQTNAAGCDSVITLNLTLTVGVEEGTLTEVTLFPNPTSESFMIRTSVPMYGTFDLLDAQGKLIYSGEMTGNETPVNIANVSRGIYYLRISDVSEPLRVIKN